MSPRPLVASVLALAVSLALAVVMLATLSAESDPFVAQELPGPFAGQTRGEPAAGSCEKMALPIDVAAAPPETGSIAQC